MTVNRLTHAVRAASVLALAYSLAQPALAQTADPAPAAPEAAPLDEADVIVTAQKRRESIRDVPIAISAFSGESLDDLKIETGGELLRAIPNVNFSKSNFSMYNFAIRGVGTKAISASSDPAVAVSFNNTPLIRNRLFEAEFFDVERLEVLRGPQGTLYGRNATAGVVNMLPSAPTNNFDANVKLEIGNYQSARATGMVNIPLGDTLAIRAAGAFTSRDGYDYNSFTDKRVNGRHLWSTRASMKWEPSDRFRATAYWQHFDEDDDRSRTGKQLCTKDYGPTSVRTATITQPFVSGRLSQGCSASSLYNDAAYGTPNGYSAAYFVIIHGLMYLGDAPQPGGGFEYINVGNMLDHYDGVVQSKNLREISTSYDPKFRAKNDLFQLNLEFDVTNDLQFVSQTAFAKDRYWSTQDYNRFVSNPTFNDSTSIYEYGSPIDYVTYPGPTPGGIYCDPQLGCSDRIVSADLSESRNEQWSQEFRLQSNWSGPLNFNLGLNYLNFKSQDDYYVFSNAFTLIAEYFYNRSTAFPPPPNAVTDPCPLTPSTGTGRECVYVDPNPIGSLDKQGHNYFLSQNGVKTESWSAFGELYAQLSPQVKLTLGARYTNDLKKSDQVPSQLLLGEGEPVYGGNTGGRSNSGYHALPSIRQQWGRFTGRAVLDWKPDLSFTSDTLVYLSASRGYKGGGVNPPRVDINSQVVQYQPLEQTYRPEYVNAFEIGTKNSFAGGRFTLNATAFLYDYKDYQISQIVDRIALNENFNATSWGLEFEAAWRPTRSLRIDANLGYLRTRLKDGSQSIDVMNRTQGNEEWTLVRPWLQVPSNCIAPTSMVESIINTSEDFAVLALAALCPGSDRYGTFNPAGGSMPFWALFGFTYDPLRPYDPNTVGLSIANGGSGAPNGGRGFYADLSGNELPNAPRWTGNIGAQYTAFVNDGDWQVTLRGDYYRQSSSFGRVYNTNYDRIKGWDNANLTLTIDNPGSGLTIQAYVKNVFNHTPITDFFTNSDDTGLTTNVFTLDPRIFGFSLSKKF